LAHIYILHGCKKMVSLNGEKTCHHGIGWDSDCVGCEDVSLRMFLDNWAAKVDKARERLLDIAATKRRDEKHKEAESRKNYMQAHSFD